MARRIPSCACDDFRSASAGTRDRFVGESQLTRRQLIGWGAAAGVSLYATRALPLTEVLQAAEADAAAAPNAPVLVAVFLPGGLDLLDTLVPADYGTYADLHPTVRVKNPMSLYGTGVQIHPGLAQGLGGGVRGLYLAGQVAFLPGIDYPDPNLSHFHSRHFWETGVISDNDGPGWLGRWLDLNGNGDNPLQGLSLAYELSPVLRSRVAPVASASAPGNSGFFIRDVYGEPFDAAMATYTALAKARGGGPGIQAARRNAKLAKLVGDLLNPYGEVDGVDPLASPVSYPANNDFADRLRSLAGLIAAPLGIRVATVDAPGDFDTHANQVATLAYDLPRISEALAAFQADLQARGVADRVLTLVWSEFGRRPHDNDSGTDHGAGGVAWVQGPRVISGFLSAYPDLRTFDQDDNLNVTMDFRTVYASLIEQWLGTDAGAVIPGAGGVGRIRLVR
ncbi:MAG: hypothetical protein QOG15_1657 [Solirubrobacteraceae bacterium]|jgi:uncharacterized protein (DUF1501 family)|nr:hypothetical protein [Solirubrobacteraceae bacterium]